MVRRLDPEERPTVAILGTEAKVGAGVVDRLARLADLRFAADEDELARALDGADILFAWDYRRLGAVARVWDRADRLAWIQMSGIGVDGIVSPQLVERDVVLTIARGVTERPIAEYVLGTLLAWAKDVPRTLELQAEHRWQHRETEALVGRRVTVLGAGGVGTAIARVLTTIGMEVTVVARNRRRDPELGHVMATTDIDSILPTTEFLVVALPLNEDSRGLLDARRLGLLPQRARLVNVGRGNIVDEAALVAALRSGHLAAAALDVFETEPLPAEHPLWNCPNLLITPHMAGDVSGWREAVADRFLANLERFLKGEELTDIVDKSKLTR